MRFIEKPVTFLPDTLGSTESQPAHSGSGNPAQTRSETLRIIPELHRNYTLKELESWHFLKVGGPEWAASRNRIYSVPRVHLRNPPESTPESHPAGYGWGPTGTGYGVRAGYGRVTGGREAGTERVPRPYTTRYPNGLHIARPMPALGPLVGVLRPVHTAWRARYGHGPPPCTPPGVSYQQFRLSYQRRYCPFMVLRKDRCRLSLFILAGNRGA